MEINKKVKDINETLSSNGWQIIKTYFEKELSELKDLNNIDDTKSSDEQAVQVKANKKAHKIVSEMLDNLIKMAQIHEAKKKKYV